MHRITSYITAVCTVCFLVVAGLLISACTMDPLFWDISNEYPPIEPLIEGAPSPIVDDGTKLYVSNGMVWEYDHSSSGDKIWKKMPSQPPASIKMVAVASAALYALSWNGNLYQWNGTNWAGVPGDPGGWERLYGAVDKLFVGTGYGVINSFSGSFVVVTGTGVDKPDGLLTGAAKVSAVYYISTMPKWGPENAGIFDASTPAACVRKQSGTVKGIIASGTSAIAVTTNLVLYGANFANTRSSGVDFTGGMALWTDGTDKILLLGLQRGSGSYSYGYREVPLDSSGDITSPGIYEPGDNSGGRATSIDPNTRETAAIGKHPVTALAVIPGSNSGDDAGRPITIASTQKNGLWSYRVRNGSPQWNGEDNGN